MRSSARSGTDVATRDFLLPDLGEGLTEGEIASWLVAVGDVVEIDQPVAEIETAKAVVEVPSPFAGTVVVLHGEVGQEVLVGRPLVTIDVGGAEVADATGGDAAVTDMVPEAAAPAVADATSAVEDEGSGNVLVGYGTGGTKQRRRRAGSQVPASQPEPEPEPVAHANGRPRAKPPVRKLAKDLGVDLAQVRGTGDGGIVTRADVEAFAGAGAGAAARDTGTLADRGPLVQPGAEHGAGLAEVAPIPAVTAAGTPPADVGVVVTDTEHHRLRSAPPADELEPTRIPVRGVRKVIAEQMTRSRTEIPEATTWVEVDATPLWEYRQRLNASNDRVKVNPLAIVMRIVVAGLRRFPEVNASLDTAANEIVLHRHVHLGFAAQTDRGLVVPVIKGADRMSVLDLAAELNRLADGARAGKLGPDDMRGGTFTLSNYGSFGVDGGAAVINHPEAAILGVGRIVDKPWVHDGQVVIRKVQQLSIAFDHRICDGGEAAGFLRFVADCVEDPDLLVASL